ncbi:hypothetical protein [Rhodosalinus sp.]|uniref:hypothetical protein n=1 Tax=Rhodosalinus sp. TaxID=2047741 RepID=UPI003978B071
MITPKLTLFGWGQETGLWSALDCPGRIVQDGSGNQAAIDVAGSGNLFSVTQSGDANRARLVVEGTANLAAIAQSGQGHLAVVRQTGTGNMVAISQSSW